MANYNYSQPFHLTPENIRAARAFKHWSEAEFSQKCHVELSDVKEIEEGRKMPSPEEMYNIRQAFQAEDIEFLPEGGIKPHQELITILEGYKGIRKFFDDVYMTARVKGGEILQIGVNEMAFVDALEKAGMQFHRERMGKLTDVFFKILIAEGDKNLLAAEYKHIEYRQVPKELFSSVPFYIYGSKLGIILWHEMPKIILLQDPQLTEAYRKQFYLLWEHHTNG